MALTHASDCCVSRGFLFRAVAVIGVQGMATGNLGGLEAV